MANYSKNEPYWHYSVPKYSMRIVVVISLICAVISSKAQTTGKDFEKQQAPMAIAQNTAKFVAVYKSNSIQNQLQQQRQAWEKQTLTNPQVGDNWLNYYVSSKLYFQQKDKNQLSNTSKESLRQIAEKMDKQLATALEKSFEKQLVRYYETKENNYKQARQYLVAAYKLNPNNTLLYPEMVLYYEIEGKTAERNTINSKIENINNNTALYKFSEALIKTLPNNSIVFTNGEYDTYAIYKAANALNKSIKVVSISLLKNDFYRAAVLKKYSLKSGRYTAKAFTKYLNSVLSSNEKQNIYISATVSKAILKPLAKNIYHTGFAYKYAAEKQETIGALYGNIMELNESSLTGTGNEVLKNLMPAYILLYRHYKENNEVAKKIYYKAKSVAQQAGFWSANYEQYFK